jgi:uncharacterized protein (DUF934 family)
MPQIIKNRTVVDDDWLVVRAAEDGGLPPPDALPAGKIIVPLSYWQASRDALTGARTAAQIGVWLAPDSEPADVVADLDAVALIAIDFPVFRDGRGYSIARLLRERYGYKGEIRAIGDVLRDQLLYMSRCGFDAFAVRADKDIHDALRAFGELTIHYQTGTDQTLPLFRRREATGARL